MSQNICTDCGRASAMVCAYCSTVDVRDLRSRLASTESAVAELTRDLEEAHADYEALFWRLARAACDAEDGCGWKGKLSQLVREKDGVTHCPKCGSTAVSEDERPVAASAPGAPPTPPACSWCKKPFTPLEATFLTVCSPCWDKNCRGHEAFEGGCAQRDEALAEMSHATPPQLSDSGPPTGMLPGQRCTGLGGHASLGESHCVRADQERIWSYGGFHASRCGYVEPVVASASPGTARCKPWCGTDAKAYDDSRNDFEPWYGFGCVFCTPACRDAGRPLNPVQETTKETNG